MWCNSERKVKAHRRRRGGLGKRRQRRKGLLLSPLPCASCCLTQEPPSINQMCPLRALSTLTPVPLSHGSFPCYPLISAQRPPQRHGPEPSLPSAQCWSPLVTPTSHRCTASPTTLPGTLQELNRHSGRKGVLTHKGSCHTIS